MAYKQLKLWFDKDLAILLADKITHIKPIFPKKKFVQSVDQQVDSLELKDRVAVIAKSLDTCLADSYENNIDILLQILGPENEEETGMFTNYYWVMPIAKYIETNGLDHFDISMNAIKEITKRNTGEYTIRPYLEQYPKKTLKVMRKWAKDKNKHVRRLACEGVRPRLPWATKLDQFIKDPKPILPILNTLKDDTSKYVQKSVANCLNDILKDNLGVGKAVVESWIPDATKERKWIIKHGLRNLLKKGDAWAEGMI